MLVLTVGDGSGWRGVPGCERSDMRGCCGCLGFLELLGVLWGFMIIVPPSPAVNLLPSPHLLTWGDALGQDHREGMQADDQDGDVSLLLGGHLGSTHPAALYLLCLLQHSTPTWARPQDKDTIPTGCSGYAVTFVGGYLWSERISLVSVSPGAASSVLPHMGTAFG